MFKGGRKGNSDWKKDKRDNSQACLTLGAVKAQEAIVAVALSCVTEAIGTAVAGTSFLTAVLSNELLIALAELFGCVTDPVAAAVLGTELLVAVLAKVRLITDAVPTVAAPVATAVAGAGGAGAVSALPAHSTLTAANLIEKSPMAAAMRDTWPEQRQNAQGYMTHRWEKDFKKKKILGT